MPTTLNAELSKRFDNIFDQLPQPYKAPEPSTPVPVIKENSSSTDNTVGQSDPLQSLLSSLSDIEPLGQKTANLDNDKDNDLDNNKDNDLDNDKDNDIPDDDTLPKTAPEADPSTVSKCPSNRSSPRGSPRASPRAKNKTDCIVPAETSDSTNKTETADGAGKDEELLTINGNSEVPHTKVLNTIEELA